MCVLSWKQATVDPSVSSMTDSIMPHCCWVGLEDCWLGFSDVDEFIMTNTSGLMIPEVSCMPRVSPRTEHTITGLQSQAQSTHMYVHAHTMSINISVWACTTCRPCLLAIRRIVSPVQTQFKTGMVSSLQEHDCQMHDACMCCWL